MIDINRRRTGDKYASLQYVHHMGEDWVLVQTDFKFPDTGINQHMQIILKLNEETDSRPDSSGFIITKNKSLLVHSFGTCFIFIVIKGDFEPLNVTAVRLAGSKAQTIYGLKRQRKTNLKTTWFQDHRLESLIVAFRQYKQQIKAAEHTETKTKQQEHCIKCVMSAKTK